MRRFLGTLGALLLVPSAASAAEMEWRPLIDAASIESWVHAGLSHADYRFADGVVTGTPIGNEPKNAFLCSPRIYGDFELRFAFRIQPTTLNSGLQFRSHVRPDGIVAGPQLEMDVMAPGEEGFVKRWIFPLLARLSGHPWSPREWPSAGVYGEELEFGWLYPGAAGGDADAFAEQGERLTRRDAWNAVRLEAVGPRVRTWLDGEARADYEHAPTAGDGLICLQVHGGSYADPSAYRIEWKDLEIRER